MDIFSVSEINSHLKNVIEGSIPSVFVSGEISNFKKHSSGHIYFSLKDENSSIRCTFFSYVNRYLNFKPKNGDRVICAGKISIYERAGNYQINVKKIIQEGKGKQQIEFEKLKLKLQDEGLFNKENKKKILKFPEKIGVLTSASSAAFQDIKNVLQRRFPVEVLLYNVIVQGNSAPKNIISGINYFNEKSNVDLIILSRGGGSQEDLFCFNDETLARTIFHSEIPIITGIGHEIDFTIADFVSDKRAPTPSAAAEIAVASKNDIIQYLDDIEKKINLILNKQLNFYHRKINNYEKIVLKNNPQNKIKLLHNRFENAKKDLFSTNKLIQQKKEHMINISNELNYIFKSNARNLISDKKNKLENLKSRLSDCSDISEQKNELNSLKHSLSELSPFNALKRGYSVIKAEKKVLRSIKDFQIDKEITLILNDGEAKAKIKKIISKEKNEK